MHAVCVNKHMHPERAAQEKGMMLEIYALGNRTPGLTKPKAQPRCFLYTLKTSEHGHIYVWEEL